MLKINIDGSSQVNPDHVGTSGIDRDSSGSVIFVSFHERVQTINLMEGLAILQDFEKAHAMGWSRII